MPDGLTLRRGGRDLEIERADDLATVRYRGGGRRAVELGEGPGEARGTLPERLEVRRLARRDDEMEELRDRTDVAFCHHVYRSAGGGRALYLTDSLTLHPRPEMKAGHLADLLGDLGLVGERLGPHANGALRVRVTDRTGMNALKVAARLQGEPDLLAVEPDLVFHVEPCGPAKAEFFEHQWYLHNPGGTLMSPGADVGAVGAWEVTRGRRDVVVAVLDDGFDLRHPALTGEGKVRGAFDFAGHDPEPLPELASENHGTCCAALAVGEDAGDSSVTGVAPGCSLMPLRTADSLSDRAVEDVFLHAAQHGAAVISCSWRPAEAHFPLTWLQEQTLSYVARRARFGKGAVIVFSAGNQGTPVSGTWEGTQHHNGFAAHPEVIAVSATTSTDRRSHYSCWGPEVSVCAPSGGIGGLSVLAADRVGPLGYNSCGDYCQFGGTSAASALVAGVAALVLSANPELTAREVREVLEATAVGVEPEGDLPGPAPDQAPGHSPWFGHGRVDAAAAVREAVARRG